MTRAIAASKPSAFRAARAERIRAEERLGQSNPRRGRECAERAMTRAASYRTIAAASMGDRATACNSLAATYERATVAFVNRAGEQARADLGADDGGGLRHIGEVMADVMAPLTSARVDH